MRFDERNFRKRNVANVGVTEDQGLHKVADKCG